MFIVRRGRTTVTIAHRLSTIRDANQIFVMGDGLVLQQGTHNELLADGQGAYARLVHAQKLREKQETTDKVGDDSSTSGSGDGEDMEKAMREEVPLGRKNTGHSLASEILEKKQKEHGDVEKGHGDPDHSLSYLFYRMGMLNRQGWKNYAFGTVFAISTFSLDTLVWVIFVKLLMF
jgi:ATP-binding cassette, subfamily B (MDR/TAP), member 1